jgi:hypothetical protein
VNFTEAWRFLDAANDSAVARVAANAYGAYRPGGALVHTAVKGKESILYLRLVADLTRAGLSNTTKR